MPSLKIWLWIHFFRAQCLLLAMIMTNRKKWMNTEQGALLDGTFTLATSLLFEIGSWFSWHSFCFFWLRSSRVWPITGPVNGNNEDQKTFLAGWADLINFCRSLDEELNHLNRTNITDEERRQSTYKNLYIFSGFSVATVLVTLLRSFLFFQICLIASKNLHNKMFSNIVCAPMRFFHTNHSGRILNRFSEDMGTIDELVPRAMINSFQVSFTKEVLS